MRSVYKLIANVLFIVVLYLLSVCPEVVAAPIKITFFDVGEGDATLIENESQGCQEHILIDTGNLATGALLSQRLSLKKDQKIDWLVLTHPHPDHIGGVFSFLAQHYILHIVDNGQPFSKNELHEGINRWYQEFVRGDSRYQKIAAPRDITLQCGGKLSVLSPRSKVLDSDWNKNSLVIQFERQQFRLLVMGDALTSTENDLLSRRDLLKPATILRCGHHGSSNTGSAEFLKLIKPQTTIVSVGTPNPFGYPDAEVLGAYERYGALLRTDHDGDISVEVDENNKLSFLTQRQGKLQ